MIFSLHHSCSKKKKKKKIQTTNFVITLGHISIDLKPIDLKAMDRCSLNTFSKLLATPNSHDLSTCGLLDT